jgi:hypothetical protein
MEDSGIENWQRAQYSNAITTPFEISHFSKPNFHSGDLIAISELFMTTIHF